MRAHNRILVLSCVWLAPCCGFQNRMGPRASRYHILHSQAADTDVSFTLPRFLADEIEEGTYPSPLHTVHVKSVLSDEEASQCKTLAYDFAEKTGCWNQPDQERHSTYSTCDFPIEDNEELASYLHDIDFDQRIWSNLEELYGLGDSCTYLDFFCAHYQANKGDGDDQKTKTMDRLEAHRDGSLISFTLLLSDPSEFEGGGTFFDGLRDVESDSPVLSKGGTIQPQRAGDATFHSGKLLHGASVITEGKRTVLVGFVDVPLFVQRPGIISEACKAWGRMDVAVHRNKRQLAQTQDGKKPGWFLNNSRWIHSDPKEGQGRSCLTGFAPAFPSVANRADPEYQRLRKLEVEDRLLRSILLPEDSIETPPEFQFADGDITIL